MMPFFEVEGDTHEIGSSETHWIFMPETGERQA
jgi:hypothetical protein